MRKCAGILKIIWGNSGESLASCGENLKKFFRKFSAMFRKFRRKCAEVTEEIPNN